MCRIIGELETLLVENEAHGTRNAKCDRNLREEEPAFGIVKLGQHLQALLEERQDGENGAALDDDVEQIAGEEAVLPKVEEFLSDNQVPGGGDGDEFGHALDDPEN